ncbi:hypothetical protein AAIA72_14650 [Hahella sp. SMD15-11]|uniref:PD-(D/E)XK nuclease superfamily protein n=1 Tax=Thermohahella caldifontis TaxID=3142973 RepID=A0AB39UVJ6_9GAMM
MFKTESELQARLHLDPQLVLSGLPDINPEFCPDAPGLVSLGREIQLSSGAIDNLFIDINAVLTFVECKRYSDSRLKREVYPQVINYASDLQNQLIHYNGKVFQKRFGDLISTASNACYKNLDAVMHALSKDPILEGKKVSEWRQQFLERLEFNVKNGVCRVIILCAPEPNSVFNYRAVRNLMQLMTFSECSTSRYDLVLMDLREEHDNLVSKIIWRRYSALPQIPLVAESIRDISAGIDRMKEREEGLPPDRRVLIDRLLEALSDYGLVAVENTKGYALMDADTRKSVYTSIAIRDQDWTVVRHQIRPPESLYELEANGHTDILDGFNFTIQRKRSALAPGKLYQIEIAPDASTDINRLAHVINQIARRVTTEA